MIQRNTKIRVLLEARHIPDEAEVAKVHGEKRYTLIRKLPLYANGTESAIREVVPAAGTVFLLDKDRTAINQYAEDTVLAWWTTPMDMWQCADRGEDDK